MIETITQNSRWGFIVGIGWCAAIMPGFVQAENPEIREPQLCLEFADASPPMTYYEPSWVRVDGPMLPLPMYERPALGDPVFQARIDELCVKRTAKTRVVPLAEALATPSRVESGKGLREKEIVLTFDDGPRLPHTPIILDILARCQIRAHFFMVGRQAKRPIHQEIIRSVVEQGHVVGSHSMTHQHHLGSAPQGIAEREINRGHDAVEKALGFPTPLFRFPYGSGTYRSFNRKLLQERGLISMQWNSASGDTVVDSVEKIIRHSLRRIGQSTAGVFLAHDRKKLMAKALPQLLNILIDRGYTFVLLSPPNMGPNGQYYTEN